MADKRTAAEEADRRWSNAVLGLIQRRFPHIPMSEYGDEWRAVLLLFARDVTALAQAESRVDARRFSFEEFIAYGIEVGGNIVNGMPWSFQFEGRPVTHENDNVYLINDGNRTLRFNRGDTLIYQDGRLTVDAALAQQAEPVRRAERPAPCARHCEATAFKIQIRQLQSELAGERAERDALLGILCRMVDLAEFWINREDRREYLEQQYKTWYALSYGSSTMRDARDAIAKAKGGGNG